MQTRPLVSAYTAETLATRTRHLAVALAKLYKVHVTMAAPTGLLLIELPRKCSDSEMMSAALANYAAGHWLLAYNGGEWTAERLNDPGRDILNVPETYDGRLIDVATLAIRTYLILHKLPVDWSANESDNLEFLNLS